MQPRIEINVESKNIARQKGFFINEEEGTEVLRDIRCSLRQRMTDDFLKDEEETPDDRDVVLQVDAKDILDRACEQR